MYNVLGALIGVTVLAGFIGWVLNIFKMIAIVGDGASLELGIRLLGIPLAIIGMIYGWF
jgi:hypothetical protein